MGYYDNILNLISLVLALSILFIILFGCQFKKHRYIEKFTDGSSSDSSDSSDSKPPKSDNVEKPIESTVDEVKPTLEGFENSILDGLVKGTMKSGELEKLIESGSFTRQNLENIISYVDQFKNKTGS